MELPALLFAAGEGRRMRPLTLREPKPLLAPDGTPMLRGHLEALRQAGVRLTAVNACYLGERIERYVRAVSPALRGMRVVCVREAGPLPLETGGGAVYALEALGGAEAFFALNADMMYPQGEASLLRRMKAIWRTLPSDAEGLLALQSVGKSTGYDGSGDFGLTPEGRAVRFPLEVRRFVFPGVQILRTSALTRGAPEGAWPLRVFYDRAAQEGRLYAVMADMPWYHIGDPAALTRAGRLLRLRRQALRLLHH